ncbi:MAG: orotate phosphoribosyltransferase [Planctomycetota bacterium]
MSVTIDPTIGDKVTRWLRDAGAIRSGHFKLSSGLHSDRYCQCASALESPEIAGRLAEHMRHLLPSELRIDTVLAPALGGVVWGYELARTLAVRSIFAERKPGETFALRRGFALRPGERVLIAEDVITTGKSVRELLPIVEASNAECVGFASIVDRSAGAFEAMDSNGSNLPAWALTRLEFRTWAEDDPPSDMAGVPVESPGSRHTARDGQEVTR